MSHYRQSHTRPSFVQKSWVKIINFDVGSPKDPSKMWSFCVAEISVPQTRTMSEVLHRKERLTNNVEELAQYHLHTDITSQKLDSAVTLGLFNKESMHDASGSVQDDGCAWLLDAGQALCLPCE